MKTSDIMYYMNLAKVVSTNSKCLSRQLGAILVKEGAVISTGYNGPPRGVSHCQYHEVKQNENGLMYLELDSISKEHGNSFMSCPRKRVGLQSGQGMDLCIAAHAEENAIVQSARNGIETNGADMFCWCEIPCVKCVIKIINAGISSVYCRQSKQNAVYGTNYFYDKNLSMKLLQKAGVPVNFIDI